MSKKIPVFYRDEMVADAQSYSPSAAKPAQVLADWQAHDLPIQLFKFKPVGHSALSLAHDSKYVADVLNGVKANGFGNTSLSVAKSLGYTSGAMTAAATEAYARGTVACAPVSGFHHAGYDFGGGFCTFNGLMVAAMMLRDRNPHVHHVGILDLDQHYGNGTTDISMRLNCWWLRHHTLGQMALTEADAESYLRILPGIMETFIGCSVLLYQAGADCHVNDPLGGLFTTEQLARRDRIVFEFCRDTSIPVAWNLAGGYQRDEQGGIEPVLEIHRNTMAVCAEVFGG